MFIIFDTIYYSFLNNFFSGLAKKETKATRTLCDRDLHNTSFITLITYALLNHLITSIYSKKLLINIVNLNKLFLALITSTLISNRTDRIVLENMVFTYFQNERAVCEANNSWMH